MPKSSTTYRKKWRAGDTTVIRVPREFAPRLLDLARRWDSGECSVVEELEGTLELEAVPQKTINYSVVHLMNVSSIPQHSPLRYPAGRTWLTF